MKVKLLTIWGFVVWSGLSDKRGDGMLTVKELEKALSRVENKDIEVVIYDEMFGGAEIEGVVHNLDEPKLNFKERVELLIGCEIDAKWR